MRFFSLHQALIVSTFAALGACSINGGVNVGSTNAGTNADTSAGQGESDASASEELVLSTKAGAAEILSGRQAIVDGAVVTGTMTDHGALDLTQAFGTPGHVRSIGGLDAADVCSRATLLGAPGEADCDGGGGTNAGFRESMSSGASRTKGGTPAQMTLADELESTSFASGYRAVPSIALDDRQEGGISSTNVTVAGVAAKACGLTGSTLNLRRDDCAARNPGMATWDGVVDGNAAQSKWELITATKSGAVADDDCNSECAEVWRDTRTGLLWSGAIGAYNWCKASGNAEASDPNNVCNNNTHQPTSAPQSVCAEVSNAGAALNPAVSGEDWANGVYHVGKGGLGLQSTPSVRWRIPTIVDIQLAEIDGYRHVTKHSTAIPSTLGMWIGTIYGPNRLHAWLYSFNGGQTLSNIATSQRSSAVPQARCVGY